MDMSKAHAELPILRGFIDFVNQQVGVYCDCLSGFQGNKVRIERQVARVLRPASQRIEDGQPVIVWASFEDPGRPDVIHQRTVRADDFVATNSEAGFNERQTCWAIIVFIYAYWDEEIRWQIAKIRGVVKDDVRVDVFGDLRLLRRAIVHDGGVLKASDHAKLKVLSGVLQPDALISPTHDEMHKIFVAIKGAIAGLILDYTGHLPGAPKVGEIVDIAIQNVGGAAVRHATEAGLHQKRGPTLPEPRAEDLRVSASDDVSLPEPLAVAVAEFEAWMKDELLADQARSTPKTTLYHYTDLAALQGIIEKQKIWCFLHSQQSDPTEVQFSMDIARRVIRQEACRGNPAVESLLLGLNDLLGNNPLGETFDFYFFSLSAHRDDAQQWHEYGRMGTGFSIGLAPTLFQPDQPELLPRANENVFVSKVTYGSDATRSRHRHGVRKLAEIVGRVSQANRDLVRGKILQAWFDIMNKAFIADLLIWNCLTAKAARFQNEQETRYILLGMCEVFNVWRREHKGRKYVETHLPLSALGNITEIIVGRLAPVGAEYALRAFLRDHGYLESIPITRSGASVA
jgi:hypothetical protein